MAHFLTDYQVELCKHSASNTVQLTLAPTFAYSESDDVCLGDSIDSTSLLTFGKLQYEGLQA